jgi:hypothetical protein
MVVVEIGEVGEGVLLMGMMLLVEESRTTGIRMMLMLEMLALGYQQVVFLLMERRR